jgi:hypothetical protein
VLLFIVAPEEESRTIPLLLLQVLLFIVAPEEKNITIPQSPFIKVLFTIVAVPSAMP